MPDLETIGKRLFSLLEDQKMGINEFAKTIKVDGSQFGKIVNDKLGITLKQVQEIISVYKVRAGWLIEGEEPMYKKESGTGIAPDVDLVTIRKEIETATASLLRLADLVPSVQEENSGQEVTFLKKSMGKTQ